MQRNIQKETEADNFLQAVLCLLILLRLKKHPCKQKTMFLKEDWSCSQSKKWYCIANYAVLFVNPVSRGLPLLSNSITGCSLSEWFILLLINQNYNMRLKQFVKVVSINCSKSMGSNSRLGRSFLNPPNKI